MYIVSAPTTDYARIDADSYVDVYEISNVTPTSIQPFRRNMGQGRHLGSRRAHVDSRQTLLVDYT